MYRKWHALVLALVVVGWLLAFGGQGSADQILAEFDVFSVTASWYPSLLQEGKEWVAQTFEATASGTVYSVDLVLGSQPENNPDNLPLKVQIRTTYEAGFNGIVPSDTVISEGSIAYDDNQFSTSYSWKRISLSSADLNAGDMYAVVVKTDCETDEAYKWYGKWKSGTDLYPDGREVILLTGGQWNFSAGDLGFRVNGPVPEPGTVVLLGLGGTGLLLYRRRRR